MMRTYSLTLFCAAALAGISVHAANAAVVGQKCPNDFGKTMMDDTHKNIIACVCENIDKCEKNQTDNLIWVAMLNTKTNINISCETGKILKGISKGVPDCVTPSSTPIGTSAPPPPKTCPAKKLVDMACLYNTPNGNPNQYNFNYTYSVGSSNSGTTANVGWSCLISSEFGYHPTVYSGNITCVDGIWSCYITRSVSQMGGQCNVNGCAWFNPPGTPWMNGPC